MINPSQSKDWSGRLFAWVQCMTLYACLLVTTCVTVRQFTADKERFYRSFEVGNLLQLTMLDT